MQKQENESQKLEKCKHSCICMWKWLPVKEQVGKLGNTTEKMKFLYLKRDRI